MIAKLKLEDIFIVNGSVVVCGPIEEGEITLSSFVKLNDILIPISRIEVFRKFVTKVGKGDNPGLFLDKDFNHLMRLDSKKTNGRGKTQFDELVYKKSNLLINIISLQQVREDKLNQLGI
jgi:translation elongation factor EF-Tu-like GTPase